LFERHRAVTDEELAVDDDRRAGRVDAGAVIRRSPLHDHDFGAEFGLRTGGGREVRLSPLSHRVVAVERDDRIFHLFSLGVG